MKLIISCLLIVVIGSCSNNKIPNGILPIQKMEKIIKDLVQVDEYLIQNVKTDTVLDVKLKRSIYYQQVFNLYKTSRKEFYYSYQYYQQHPNFHKAIFDTLAQRFTREKMDTSSVKYLK